MGISKLKAAKNKAFYEIRQNINAFIVAFIQRENEVLWSVN